MQAQNLFRSGDWVKEHSFSTVAIKINFFWSYKSSNTLIDCLYILLPWEHMFYQLSQKIPVGQSALPITLSLLLILTAMHIFPLSPAATWPLLSKFFGIDTSLMTQFDGSYLLSTLTNQAYPPPPFTGMTLRFEWEVWSPHPKGACTLDCFSKFCEYISGT